MQNGLSFGRIGGRTVALLLAYPLTALVGWLVQFVPSVAIDLYGGHDGYRLHGFVGMIGLFAQYWATRRVLAGEGMLDLGNRPGVWSFIGVTLLGGLAISLGTLLLIVPGLYLAARWIAAVPIVIGEGARMGDAMRDSGERTLDARGAIMALVAITSLPWVLAVAVPWMAATMPFLTPEQTSIDLVSADALLVNGLLFLSSVAGWFLALAAHALSRTAQSPLEKVFV